MRYVCPTADWARELDARLENYCSHFRLPEVPPGFSHRMVKVLLDDHLNRRLKWASPDDSQYLNYLNQLTSHWRHLQGGGEAPSLGHHMSYLLDSEVFWPIENKVIRWLDQHVPQPTWAVVTTQPLGRDTLIDIGEDYRILDWEAKVLSGDIPCDTYIRRRLQQREG